MSGKSLFSGVIGLAAGITLLLSPLSARALEDLKSAHRAPGQSYLEFKARAHVFGQGISAVDAAAPFSSAHLPPATAWPSRDVMAANFARFRDTRWMTLPSRPDFPRRSSWLYPDDGCFARAALAIFNLARWGISLPNKVFVFGDLAVRTPNSPDGLVTWWYHVAPLVEVDGLKYVLDPAIEPRHPLKLEDWLATMSATPDDLEVAVCGSGTYSPSDACSDQSDGREVQAARDQREYLNLEWRRVSELGRDPVTELGDNPPWSHE